MQKDAEIWKFRINNWFRREGVVSNENKFSYIIAAVVDDIIKLLRKEQIRFNKISTLNECVALIRKTYGRKKKVDKFKTVEKNNH